MIRHKEIEKSEAMTREDTTWKPDNKVKPFDEFAGLTDFEKTFADICIGWIGKEMGWEQYIKDNADFLLRIAFKKFNSVQDVPFEQKPAFLDLETKEVDLEKEIDKIWNPRFNLGWDEKSLLSMNHEGFTTIAKYFYELGLKAKEE